MPEPDFLKAAGEFVALGLLAWVLWMNSKRFMDAHAAQVAVTQEQQSKRIDALEEANRVCHAHRMELQKQIIELLTENKKV